MRWQGSLWLPSVFLPTEARVTLAGASISLLLMWQEDQRGWQEVGVKCAQVTGESCVPHGFWKVYCGESVYFRTKETWGSRSVSFFNLSFYFLNFGPDNACDRCWGCRWEMAGRVVLSPSWSAPRAMLFVPSENLLFLCQTHHRPSYLPTGRRHDSPS